MTTLAAGSSVAVTLAAGYAIYASGGYGTMQVAPPNTSALFPITPAGASVGPFPLAVTVNLTATSAITYRTDADSVTPDFVTLAIDPLTGKAASLTGPDGGGISLGGAPVAAQLPLLRAKLAKIRAGLTTGTNGIDGQLKLGIIGDSTTMGGGAGSGGAMLTTNARPKCIGRQLVSQFTQLGIAARADTFMGDQFYYAVGGSLTGYPLYDPRVAFSGTTGIVPSTTYASLGGIYFQLKAASDTLTFTPENSWDTAVIYYENGAAGVATMTLGNAAAITGGSTVTTTSSGGAFSFGKQTITIAKAATSLIFTQTSGQPIIRGVWCYDSTIPSVNIFNLGAYGQQLNALQSSMSSAFASDLYDVVVINMSINDIGAAVSTDTYIAALSAMVASAKAAGADVLVATTSVTNRSAATNAPYQLAINQFAFANSIPLIDLNTRMGTYAVANANGLLYDGLHPSPAGYQDIATAYGNVLVRP